MNILMVTTDFPPTVGGISAHVFELAKAMVQAGHRVSVLSRRHAKSEPQHETMAGIEVHRMTYWPPGVFYGLQIRRQVKALLPDLKPDIVHIHAMRPLEWYDITAVPLAYTNHTSGYLKRLRKGGLRRMWQLKRLFAKPQLFLAPSRELLETPFEITGKKLFIPNGVDARRYQRNQEVRALLRSQLGIADDERLCVITRRLVWKNGVIFLAQASQYVTDPKIKFLVIGDGPEREIVEATFKQHCGDRVTFVGAKLHDDIIKYYSAADFSVLPSIMEATSISGLEAMAASLPLVGTKVGGIPDLIDEGKTGFLCEDQNPEALGDALNKLLSADLATMGKAANERAVQHFDWAKIAKQTVSAYEAVL